MLHEGPQRRKAAPRSLKQEEEKGGSGHSCQNARQSIKVARAAQAQDAVLDATRWSIEALFLYVIFAKCCWVFGLDSIAGLRVACQHLLVTACALFVALPSPLACEERREAEMGGLGGRPPSPSPEVASWLRVVS